MIRLAGGGGGGAAPLTFFGDGEAFTPVGPAAADEVYITGFVLPYELTFSNIGVDLHNTDNANDYDIGIYDQAGNLVADIGAQPLPAGGVQTFATVQGVQTINPGLYLFAFTGAAIKVTFNNDSDSPVWVLNANVAASVGGALPASIGAVAVAPTGGRTFLMLF